jgi:hypothetical protein
VGAAAEIRRVYRKPTAGSLCALVAEPERYAHELATSPLNSISVGALVNQRRAGDKECRIWSYQQGSLEVLF